MADLLDKRDSEYARAALARRVGASRLWVLAVPAHEALEPLLTEAGIVPDAVVSPLTGMPVRCLDLRALGREVREEGGLLVVDLTLCGPLCCDALRLGAHAFALDVDESLCVVGLSRDGMGACPGAAQTLDGLAQADEGLCERALSLLELQQRHWCATSDAAQVVASYLRCHPAVEALSYPGLKGDASFDIAARTLQRGFGPLVDYRLQAGGWQRHHATTREVREQVLDLEAHLRSIVSPA